VTRSNPGFTGTEEYYERRAAEYDEVYRKPERQADLRSIKSWLTTTFHDRRVLEIASGTGYWTQFFADSAQAVKATDINRPVLEVAQARRTWPSSTDFLLANAFDLHAINGEFDTAFVGFFWSHLRLDQLEGFLTHLADRIESSGRLVFMDNNYVAGSNHAVTRTDKDGNTYQRRHLDDGTAWDVLKNFPTEDQLRSALIPIAQNIEITYHEYYWIADVILDDNPRAS